MTVRKVHHLNCGTMCPYARRWLNEHHRMVCHCLLVETDNRLVLVDAGLGLDDVRRPNRRLGWIFTHILRPSLDEAETVLRQVEALGYSADDVRHIVPTHLDLDHIGGLSDFPNATVHVLAPEYEAAMNVTWRTANRYRRLQWAHQPQWQIYKVNGERWKDFACVRELKGLPPEILLVPLVGHSQGHCGVAVQTPEGEWLLHAGDAYFHHNEVHGDPPGGSLLLSFFQRTLASDNTMRLRNQERLRHLAATQGDEVQVFSAHDPGELAAMSDTSNA